MRTDKHKLTLSLEQEAKLLEIMKAYQEEKNFFSDMLNNYSWNSGVNFWQGCSYRKIRNSLVEQNYVPKNNKLPARAWRLALEEAFQLHERTKLGQFYFYTNFKEENAKKLKLYHLSEAEKHVLNYIFFSWKNFIDFAKIVFDYKLCNINNKNIKKTLKISPKFYKNFYLYMESIFLQKAKIETSKRENYNFYKTSNKLINKLVVITKKIFQTKQILTKVNPTIRLDSDCYKLYQDKDGNNYIDIICLDKRNRIKGIKLTGYKGNLPKKQNFSSNLVISFNSTTMEFYIHFTFKSESKNKTFNKKIKLNLECNKDKTLGMDFGITEFGTLSDGNVVGAKQGEILSQLNQKSEQLIAKIQKTSLFGYFGVELNNKEGKRNHANNCFNHNLRNKNINLEYRTQQEKTNRRLYNLKYTQVKELLDYCQLNNITQLILENLNFSQLQTQGKNKYLKQNLNLIKGCFSLLKEKIENNYNNHNINLSYVNPAFTSQTCPACFFVEGKNRQGDNFRCQHCGFQPQLNDVRYKEAKLAQPNLSSADFIAALNIKAFHFHEHLKGNLYLKKEEIKKKLLEIHEIKKESFCKDHFIRSSVG